MTQGLEHLTFTAQISDPIWGAFPITQLEEELLETPELCRLEHIKQMGLAFLDYPSLTHTRLEHSLGVMYVADQIFTTIRETARQVYSAPKMIRLFNPDYHQAVRLAALLHDLGHPPFSHAVELTFIRYPGLLAKAQEGLDPRDNRRILFTNYSHESFTRWIISHSDNIKPLLNSHFGDNGKMANEIARLAVGKATRQLAPFNTIISGDFDADRIDYLIRDNRHSGFAIGLSPDELYNAVHLHRTVKEKKENFEIYIDRNALPFVNSVLAARERLINRVHLAPAGRAATQMLNRFLFEDLVKSDGQDLARTILRLHSKCTDFTFFDEIRSKLPPRPQRMKKEKAKPRNIAELIKSPAKRSVWTQFAHLGFMKMQPCLRLLSYLAATASYDNPQDLICRRKSSFLFLEPSVRPAPRFSLLVDYDCKPQEPSFDFIASTENRQGRAILGQSLSNLDVFAYSIDGKEDKLNVCETEAADSNDDELFMGLSEKERLLARHASKLARKVKQERDICGNGMLPTEFLLTTLYYLEKQISQKFPDARAIYAYSAECFINSFLDSLVKAEDWPLPKEFHSEDRVNSNRIFSDIQRLNVFGLIETRQRPTFHVPNLLSRPETRRTREGVYGTREDFRISHWGKYYVETEVAEDLKAIMRRQVDKRQEEVTDLLEKMAGVYPHEPNFTSAGRPEISRVAILERFFRESLDLAHEISNKGGCVMIFRIRDRP